MNEPTSWHLRARVLVVVVGAIWGVSLYALMADDRLQYALAVVPRELAGLVGIVGMPFVHGTMEHLLANTVPLLVFGLIVVSRGVAYFLWVSAGIVVLGGLGLWLFGRESAHIGASGLVFGYFGLLVVRGLYERSLSSVGASLLVIILYGGMIFGVLPGGEEHVSWEAHLCGLIAGIAVARLRYALDQRRQTRPAAHDG